MVKQDNQFVIEKSKEFLARTILSFTDIPNEVLQKIINAFEPVHYEKNYQILKAGDLVQYTYFICKGIIKVSYNQEDKEIIDWFAEEGVFISNFTTYQAKQPVMETYEAIENVELLRMRYTDVEGLLIVPEVERAIRIMYSKYHTKYVHRTQNLKALTAEKKYHLFMTEYAEYTNRIPLKYIANYLGITSETLSRVRAKYDKSIK